MTSQKKLLHGYTRSICPRIQLVIKKNKKQAQGWSPTWHGDDDLSIFGVTNDIETYCVDLKKEVCSCRNWDLFGIPCCHVIACIWNIKKQPEDYLIACYMPVLFFYTWFVLFMYTCSVLFFYIWSVLFMDICGHLHLFTACYRKSTFIDTYSKIVYPTNGPQLCHVDDLNTMAPPVMRRAIDRSKNIGTR